MSNSFIYYVESNIVCIILFAIMLAHDRLNVDKQEKHLKYDRTLIAFMLYFISDLFWIAVTDGILPKNTFTVLCVNFLNFIIISGVTYSWLNFVMAVEDVPRRERGLNQFAIVFPFLLSLFILIISVAVAPRFVIDKNLEMQTLYNVLFIIVPAIYIIAVLFYSIRKSISESDTIERRKYLFIGFFPIAVLAGGFLQLVVLPDIPVFCFCSTLLMVILYVNSMETRISLDPLTGLNNRNQLLRFFAQESNLAKDDKRTFVIMLDINDFKLINDTFGHSEGDRALTILAKSLKNAANSHNPSSFLCRYGGDEFIAIIKSEGEGKIRVFIEEIRNQIDYNCEHCDAPYKLSVGIGYDELLGESD